MHVQECLRQGRPIVLSLVRANYAFEVTGQADKHSGMAAGKLEEGRVEDSLVSRKAVVLVDLSEANESKGQLQCLQGEFIDVVPRPGNAWVRFLVIIFFLLYI